MDCRFNFLRIHSLFDFLFFNKEHVMGHGSGSLSIKQIIVRAMVVKRNISSSRDLPCTRIFLIRKPNFGNPD